MNVEFSYAIGDRVHIFDLKCAGRVVALFLDAEGPQYRIRYMYEGSIKYDYFFADEIE